MPAFLVSVDGITLASVSADGYDVISLHVGGTRVDADPACLNLSGSRFPGAGDSTYLTWISQVSLREGQVLRVSFAETAVTSHAGKTIDELFPDEPTSTQPNFKAPGEIIAELRATPLRRQDLSFRVLCSAGSSFEGTTATDEHGFGFTVLWDSERPDRARTSLHSYTLTDLETRGPLNYHIEAPLHYGDWVEFELVAEHAARVSRSSEQRGPAT